MTKYVAFLRAINVGGHTVKMDHLRGLFDELELANVETFIASGNVIFDAPGGKASALEKRLASHLKESLGYDVATFLRTTSELELIANHEPFSADDVAGPGHRVYVSFVGKPIQPDAEARVLAYRGEFDDFHIRNREVYWLSRVAMTESVFTGAVLERALGRVPATIRNITTVRRLAAKYC